MKVLLTGAGGALGSVVSLCLTEAGHDVVPHDRQNGDLRSLPHVREVVDGVSAVVHAAAIPSPKDGPDDEIFQNNVQTTYNVLDTAGRFGVPRIVYVSSASAVGLAWSELGVSPVSVPVTEDHPYVGEDVYGLSKQIGETIAAATSRRWGATVVSLRFPFIGSGERLLSHLSWVHADHGVDRGGLWAWLDMRDAARAVLAALTASLTGHHIVNVAAPDTTALIPTAELLRTYHPGVRVDRELGEFESLYARDRSRSLLGFEPLYGWRSLHG
ncbi:NAD(P)-dependent oxidoreductase [Actinocrispum sp. NPDC049592]|uniref:NAD-dependent epimerase/dehydratase family protein n=1 Tax=Actinocrispum sp. NPDC049592 TaxID=3154835 RepID=UPI003416B786